MKSIYSQRTIIWIGALIIGAILGMFGFGWLDQLMTFIASIYTRLFQLLAVPTIVLAIITTLATFGSKGYALCVDSTRQPANGGHRTKWRGGRNASDVIH